MAEMAQTIYDVELILPYLTSERAEEYFNNITQLYNRDTSRIDINVDFLDKFPNLTEFNGRLLLNKPSDLEKINKLNYRILILNLNNLIGDPVKLDNLIRHEHRLVLRNLAGAGGVSLRIHRGCAEFIVDDEHHHNINAWMTLLASENIHRLNTKYCHEDFLSKLPPNIECLEVNEPLFNHFEPAHPVSLVGKLDTWHGHHVSENIHQLVLPLRQDPEELLTHNPHLNFIGFYPDLEHISMFRLIDKINDLLQTWPGTLTVWVPNRVNQIFLEKKMTGQRVRVLIANW
jgi:hypothetical protein